MPINCTLVIPLKTTLNAISRTIKLLDFVEDINRRNELLHEWHQTGEVEEELDDKVEEEELAEAIDEVGAETGRDFEGFKGFISRYVFSGACLMRIHSTHIFI